MDIKEFRFKFGLKQEERGKKKTRKVENTGFEQSRISV